MQRSHRSERDPFTPILRKAVTRVIFVLDYFHLEFDNHGTLTVAVPPLLEKGGLRVGPNDAEFRTVLEDLVGIKLIAVQVFEQQQMLLEFQNGTKLAIPIDNRTGESVVLSKARICSRSGDQPITNSAIRAGAEHPVMSALRRQKKQ